MHSASAEVTGLSVKVRDIIKLLVVCEKSDTGWAAYVPSLPGAVTTDPTEAEVRFLIREAIEFHLEGLKEDRFPIRESSAEAQVVSVLQR